MSKSKPAKPSVTKIQSTPTGGGVLYDVNGVEKTRPQVNKMINEK